MMHSGVEMLGFDSIHFGVDNAADTLWFGKGDGVDSS